MSRNPREYEGGGKGAALNSHPLGRVTEGKRYNSRKCRVLAWLKCCTCPIIGPSAVGPSEGSKQWPCPDLGDKKTDASDARSLPRIAFLYSRSGAPSPTCAMQNLRNHLGVRNEEQRGGNEQRQIVLRQRVGRRHLCCCRILSTPYSLKKKAYLNILLIPHLATYSGHTQ